MGRRLTPLSMKKFLVFCALALVLSGCAEPEKTTTVSNQTPAVSQRVVHRSFFMERDFFDRAFKNESGQKPVSAVIAGIIPHHLLASHLIARFWLGLDQRIPSVVVVIGPNHFNNGHGPIISSLGEWSTPYGTLWPATDLINVLADAESVKIDERVFEREHSISGEVSFIQKTFPETKIIPIVLKSTVTDADSKKLAAKLDKILPADALIIASVDFSHEVTAEVADEQAETNISVLRERDSTRVGEMYVDSQPTIIALLEYVNLRGAENTILLENSNAAKVAGDPSLKEVTSYLTMYFTK